MLSSLFFPVSLGFFDDILIPPESLQQPAKFDDTEQVWVWEYETEEGAHDLYMDTGEEIRFRVVDESFVDTSPTGPSSAEATSSSEELPKKEAPYTLVGSISEPGLGLLSWWTSS
nr:PREDICTED: DNA-directed RNA polymerase III subunit RPC8 [Equus przewalskii]